PSAPHPQPLRCYAAAARPPIPGARCYAAASLRPNAGPVAWFPTSAQHGIRSPPSAPHSYRLRRYLSAALLPLHGAWPPPRRGVVSPLDRRALAASGAVLTQAPRGADRDSFGAHPAPRGADRDSIDAHPAPRFADRMFVGARPAPVVAHP